MVRKGKKKSASQDNPAEDTADSAAGQPGLGPAPAVTSSGQPDPALVLVPPPTASDQQGGSRILPAKRGRGRPVKGGRVDSGSRSPPPAKKRLTRHSPGVATSSASLSASALGTLASGTGLAAVEEEAPSPPDEDSPSAAEHAQVGAAGIGVAAGARADEHVAGTCMDCSQSEGEGEEEGGREDDEEEEGRGDEEVGGGEEKISDGKPEEGEEDEGEVEGDSVVGERQRDSSSAHRRDLDLDHDPGDVAAALYEEGEAYEENYSEEQVARARKQLEAEFEAGLKAGEYAA
eukprot:scaffold6635_cov97-Isochrysis_galbana.AAC.1